ncbi:MAG: HD domain-containing protein [Candidatus Uhrbacteria bacterium]
MNLSNQQLEQKFERAVKLLCDHLPVGQERKKPLLMHCFRVGIYLYENDYSEDVVVAGLLHDMIEWTDCPEKEIRDEFGQKVFDIVLANTKNRDIKDVDQRRKDYVDRCVEVGDDALIVKAADVIDSYKYYQATENQIETERSVVIAKLIVEKGLTDKIIKELEQIE